MTLVDEIRLEWFSPLNHARFQFTVTAYLSKLLPTSHVGGLTAMHIETERRFVASPKALSWCRGGTDIEQGYLRADGLVTLRVRIAGDTGSLTIKGRRYGCSRLELETPIPLMVARSILRQIPSHMKVKKTRYNVEINGLTWEIDVFGGSNAGLILAEVELDDPSQYIRVPDWAIHEITTEHRYSNSHLARNPYCEWAVAA